MINKFLIIIITCLSLFFRLWQINQLPPSPNWDEVSLGYNAYSILHTGHDEWGSWLPLIFRAYGDFKLPLYIYLSLPFIATFGLNTLSIKLVSIVAGTISCLIFYLITQQFFPKSKTIPFLGLVIYAFSPWSIFLSRLALEANLFLCFFLISFYFLISGRYWQSTFFYGLCLFTYNSSRVLLIPYLIILAVLLTRRQNYFVKNWPKLLFFLITIILFLFQSLTSSGQARYKWVSLLDSGAINQINELRTTYPRLIVNKYTYFAYHASLNYFKHFDPRYLFLNGSSHYQFNIPNFPLISPLFFPFFILGFVTLIHQNIRQRSMISVLLLLFTIVSPLPSAITRDAPQILRSLTFMPFVTIITLYGLSYFRPRLSTAYSLIAIAIWLCLFWQRYPLYTIQYAGSWQYGYSQIVDYLQDHYSSYSQIIVTKKYGEPHEFILFYTQYDPRLYQSNKIWDYHADWYWVNGFDKYQFVNDWEIKNIIPTQPTLLITTPNNYNQDIGHLQKTINFPDGTPAFDIVIYD